MSFEQEVHSAIRGRWKTLVEEALALPTKYPGMPFTPPSTGKWAQLEIDELDAEQADIGESQTTDRHSMVVNINLYFPRGGSSESPQALIDSIKPLWRKLQLTSEGGLGMIFEVPKRSNVGDYDRWYVVNLQCPFKVDEVT